MNPTNQLPVACSLRPEAIRVRPAAVAGLLQRAEATDSLPNGLRLEARDWERLFIGEIKAGRDPQIKGRSSRR
jgi:hypothetical protein